ncbi:Pectate disaccharide-lyase [Caldicellulosiruptor owensensis OL]|uniref:Pectate disaccharide-lyase n=2 Tax=Caldicellulosiruptor owensensis TaxID=55205 RepID=E4Q6L2_CALOW|nr:Pectate disaccharide-lyase [Caldicellulosiruptor owensensis OL]
MREAIQAINKINEERGVAKMKFYKLTKISLSFLLILSLILSQLSFVFAEGTSNILSDWEFRAFGSNTSADKNPLPTFNSDGSITLKATGGKIASTDEGISFYFKTIASDASFEIRAKAAVISFNSNSSISTPNQKSFGIMLREKVGANGDSTTQTSNYILVGALDTVMKAVYKESGQQTKITLINTTPTTGMQYDLSIKKSGNTYVVSCNGTTQTFNLDNMFGDYIYAGLYVARDAEITFSNFEIVEIREVKDLRVDTSSMKTEYIVGEDLDLSGLKVTAIYTDGTEETLSKNDYIVTGFDNTKPGVCPVTIQYGNVSKIININILPLVCTGLEIKYLPIKTEYYIGDKFNPEGLVVIGKYNNGKSLELTSDKYKFSISGIPIDDSYVFNSSGKKTIMIISVENPQISTSFDVNVKDAQIIGLEIKRLPNKVNYFIGEELDLKGLIVYAKYSDNSEVKLMDGEYSYTPIDTTVAGNKEVTISYKGVSTKFMVTVKEKQLIGIEVTTYPKTTYYIGESFDPTGLVVSKVYDNGDKEILSENEYTIDISRFDSSTSGIYDIKIVPVNLSVNPIIFKVTVRERKEYEWKSIRFGQSTSDTKNFVEIKDDGAIRIVALDGGGKVATDHDGITFYYTELDATKDNFVLSADIKVINYAKTPHDGQESFGIMARDAIGTPGDSSVFASNMVAVGGFSGGTKKPNGTQLFMRIGVTSPDGTGSKGIQNIMLKEEKPTIDNTYPAKTYRLTLAKTNSGFIGKLFDGVEEKEAIFYEPDILSVQTPKMYVGFFAARVAEIEVYNIDFRVTASETDPPRVMPPQSPTIPDFSILSLDKTSKQNYNLLVRSNVDGFITIVKGSETIVQDRQVKANEIVNVQTKLNEGTTDFRIVFLPDNTQYLTSYDRIIKNFTVTMKTYAPGGDIYVAPNGTSDGDGTIQNPLDLDTAIDFVREGQKIILLDGVYVRSTKLEIKKYNDGAPNAMKYLVAAPGARPVIDFDKKGGGFVLSGNYWYIKGIDFARSAPNTQGAVIGGSYNVIELCNFYENGDTGLQISRTDLSSSISDWPSYNLIINCTSYNNRDPSENNADGFAAKLTSGVGNVFRGCIAHHNTDDGWDLYTKLGTGAIGPVTIEDCVAYENGYLTDGTVTKGDGNGFKLGGEGIAVGHVVKSSIAFGNRGAGFTSNSNPAVQIYNCVSYNNVGSNIALYSYTGIPLQFKVENFVSYRTVSGPKDSYPESVVSDSNYFWNGTESVNKKGIRLTESNFASLEKPVQYSRDSNGNIIWGNFLKFIAPKISTVEIQPQIIPSTETILQNVEKSEIELQKETKETKAEEITQTVAAEKQKETNFGKVVEQTNKATVIIDLNKISKEIAENTKKEIGFDVTGISLKPVKEISIPMNVVKSAGEKDKIISIKSDDISIKFNSRNILTLKEIASAEDETNSIVFALENKEQKVIDRLKPVSGIYNITVKTGKGKINSGFTVQLAFEVKNASDIRKVGIYYLNETSKKWEYVGGKVDKKSNVVVVEINHLSTYGAFEYDKQFKDVPKDFWAYEPINILASKHIIKGRTEETFEPNLAVTRAEFIAMVARTLGIAEEDYKGEFEDVKKDAWYANIIEAAYKAGIVAGNGKKIRPDEPIKREEMIMVVMRAYSKLTGFEKEHFSLSYSDASQISTWAREAIENAARLGIVTGYNDNTFKPQKNSTRSEAAAILYRILEKAGVF